MLQFYEPDLDYGTPVRYSEVQVELTIDGAKVTVPEGTSVMRAAMEAGSENLITFERRQAYCQGALVVQDPLDPTNNVTAGCFSFTTLQNEFRKAQVRIQSRYFEFRSLSLSINSNRESKNQVTNQEAISVLGALFDVPHHQNVVRYTAALWCPPEINMKKRQSSMDSMKINNSYFF